MMDNQGTEYDVVVVGGGPAGLMAGSFAASRGLRVLVADKMESPCRKLLLSGKGRCNVINNCDREAFFDHVRSGSQFLRSSYASFDAQDIMAFFEERGVPLKTERGGRVFPQSDRSGDIADALVKSARGEGCQIRRMRAVKVLTEAGEVRGILTDKGSVSCRAAIVATGGLSYPRTGSTGDGYRLAAETGHCVTPPTASLVPLDCVGGDYGLMQGLSLRNVRLTAVHGGRKLFSEQGEMLFTHFGVSGPLVLSLSGFLEDATVRDVRVTVDLKPALEAKVLDKRLLRDFSENSNREFKNSLGALLPRKMIPVILKRCGIDPGRRVREITVQERRVIVEQMKGFSLEILRKRPIDEAIVTAGGVSLPELDPKTMMSKKVRNLHFAGEVIDADAFTGGFNLGIAFITGHTAGVSVLKGENTK